MRHHSNVFCFCIAAILTAALSGCSPAAATMSAAPAPNQSTAQPAAAAPAAPAAPEAKPKQAITMIYQAPAATAAPAAQAGDKAAGGGGNAMPDPSQLPKPNRLIIKNGEMSLEVDDTDTAIDRISQMAADLGGYVISSQTDVRQVYDQPHKYGSLSIGVPSSEFETAQRRLRQIARRVTNETASGQDVTDEYVDQESRLNNLKATRDRIRTFLDNAKTVEEALKVNEQLKQVEDEIEQVQGRMNYLFDRAAYSTLAISLEPFVPTPTPSETPTVTATPTVTITPTPTPWTPGKTLTDATDTLGNSIRGTVDFLIYSGVVCLPFLIPIAAVIWFAIWLRRRIVRGRKPAAPPPPVEPPVPGA